MAQLQPDQWTLAEPRRRVWLCVPSNGESTPHYDTMGHQCAYPILAERPGDMHSLRQAPEGLRPAQRVSWRALEEPLMRHMTEPPPGLGLYQETRRVALLAVLAAAVHIPSAGATESCTCPLPLLLLLLS